MEKQLRYTFNYIDNCNMCGSGTNGHKIFSDFDFKINCN